LHLYISELNDCNSSVDDNNYSKISCSVSFPLDVDENFTVRAFFDLNRILLKSKKIFTTFFLTVFKDIFTNIFH